MEPITDPITITVKDMKVAEPFYDKFMPALGFNLRHKFKGTVAEHK